MRIQKVYLLILFLVVLAVSAPASTLQHDFEKGNESYSSGDYQQAIQEYEKVVRAGYQSSSLNYNLGNAYFREGLLGQAIMNYYRARRIDPRDDDIRANLEFARQFAIDKIEISSEAIFFEYINRFFDSFSLNEIVWISVILYLLFMVSVFCGYLYNMIKIPNPVFVFIICLFVIASVFTGVKLDRDVLTRNGVVISQQTDVKNGPSKDYDSQFTAHAGLVFNIEREESGYYLVNFENRVKGWIDISTASEI